MRVVLTSAAEADLAAALEWYDGRSPGIAPRFLEEFQALAHRLADGLCQFPRVYGETRRAGFRRFPYGLFFQVKGDKVVVFACFHASRDPARWRSRS
ncbi:type II toxin-antitoxin system RelE/ParE family toxin [Magnetospirillum sp. UT-4]|uniref:type II toxin-antitoxin system RelE/ParE family toxin n=1 Tax=Magnetospirillum sp. UT-4 TaxID=2681467 RepID=UPI00137E213E|nr:conserved hypothetical protein [Magnetospirillum sp. UT-4]